MPDAGQLLDEAPAGGENQAVVDDIAGARLHGAAVIGEARDFGRDKAHALALQKAVQRHDQILTAAQAARDPDDAWKVVQFRARCDQRDLRRGITAPQFADRRQAGKARTQDHDVSGILRGRHGSAFEASPARSAGTGGNAVNLAPDRDMDCDTVGFPLRPTRRR